MFYKDLLPINNQTTLKVKLTDFSSGMNTKVDGNILPLNVAKNTYNFNFSSGALTQGLGFKDLTIPYGTDFTKTMQVPQNVTKIEKVWVYKRYVAQSQTFSPLLVFFSSHSGNDNANELYYGRVETALNTFNLITNGEFSQVPVGINLRINGQDSILFCAGSNDSMKTWDGINLPQIYPNAPKITSLAKHANRLFATVCGDKSKLLFSAESNPTAWNENSFEGGYIELVDERGTLNRVLSYNNSLYVIREFGITRLTGAGEEDQFVLKHLSLSNSQIYAKTACLCGDRILMLLRDGLYVFDGIELSKLNLGFESLLQNVDNSNACSEFLDGKYYLALKIDTNDFRYSHDSEQNFKNNALLEYDINTGEYSILRGIDICSLTAFQHQNISKLIACFNSNYENRIGELTHDGKVFGTNTTKVWESPYTDFGYPDKNKIIKSITLTNKNDSEIAVFVEGKKHVFAIPQNQTKTVKVPINLRANMFAIGFYSNSDDCYISNPQIEINLE